MPAKRALSAALALLLVAAIPARAASVPTIRVVDTINPGPGSSSPINTYRSAALGDYLYFSATDGPHGYELWRTNGTTTQMVIDLNAAIGASSYPTNLTAFNGYIYFSADNGAIGDALWRTNGAITELVLDINPTDDGLLLDDSGPYGFTPLGDFLYFSANNGHGRELWRTDGTTGGTTLVFDINTQAFGGFDSSSPDNFTVLGSYLYFSANDGIHGDELWRTNGEIGGTTLVRDINTADSGTGYSWPQMFTAFGDHLYFRANSDTHAGELWRSDGSTLGTTRITDAYYPNDFTAFGEYLYFEAQTDADGYELWRTDGTEAGTVQFLDINGGSADSYPYNFTVVGSFLYFHATDSAHGKELWRTNGATTALVYDIISGANDADPDEFTAFGDWLYFSAETAAHGGAELWRSNGTTTEKVPFSLASQTMNGDDYGPKLLIAGGRLYMSAFSDLTGAEFAYLDESLPPTNGDGGGWTATLVILTGLTAAAGIGLRLRGAKRA